MRPVVGHSRPDALNRAHPSTIVCPLTSGVAGFPTVPLPKGVSGLERASDILVDQVKAIDNRRLHRKLGALPDPYLSELRRKLLCILDFGQKDPALERRQTRPNTKAELRR